MPARRIWSARHTGRRGHTRCGLQSFSGAAREALAPHRGTPPAPSRHARIPAARPTSPTKAASAAPRWEAPAPRGERAARPSPGPGSAQPPPERAQPHRVSGYEPPRGARQRLAWSRGRAGWASGPRGVPRGCGAAAGGMGAGAAEAARRPPQPRCLSFGLCGVGGSPTSSAKRCAKQRRAGEARQTRCSAGPPPPPRATRPPARPGPRGPPARRPRSLAGAGERARALARCPPQCSRPEPRRAP